MPTSNITLEQLQLFEHIDSNVAVLTLDGEVNINGNVHMFVTSDSFNKWKEEHKQDIEDKNDGSFIDRIGKVLDYVIQNQQVNGLYINGLAPTPLYITHDDLQPLKDVVDSFCILYACVNNTIDKKKTAQLMKDKEIYFIGELMQPQKGENFGVELIERAENGESHLSIKVFLTREHAEKYNANHRPVTKCTLYDLAKFYNGLYGIIIEPHCNYWVEFTTNELIIE